MQTLITVKIHDLARGGAGVAKLDTGEIIFVPYSAPGDELKVRVTQKSKTYSHAEIVEIISPSPERIKAPCAVFSKCGGCSWQHIPYSLQFETKTKGLLQTLKKSQIDASSIHMDSFPAEKIYGYRNRIQLQGNSSQEQFGFRAKGSKEIVNIESCPVADDKINQALPKLKKEGFGEFPDEFKLEVEVTETGEIVTAWNQRHGAHGFRQIHDEQNAKLVQWISDHLKPSDILFDLYGGFGNLSIPVADRFKRVECVDVFARSSPLAPPHFRMVKMDMNRWTKEATSERDQKLSSSVLLDPPREGVNAHMAGLQKKLSQLKINSMILVGCDVDSFAKDCKQFVAQGFKLERLAALDLFPQTPHLESLALFSK